MPDVVRFALILDDPRRNALRIGIVGLIVVEDDRVHIMRPVEKVVVLGDFCRIDMLLSMTGRCTSTPTL